MSDPGGGLALAPDQLDALTGGLHRTRRGHARSSHFGRIGPTFEQSDDGGVEDDQAKARAGKHAVHLPLQRGVGGRIAWS
jgi:hypothetical protein